MSPLGGNRAQCTKFSCQLRLSAPGYISQPGTVQCFWSIIWFGVKERHHPFTAFSIGSTLLHHTTHHPIHQQSICLVSKDSGWHTISLFSILKQRLALGKGPYSPILCMTVLFLIHFRQQFWFDLTLLWSHSISSTANSRARVGMKLVHRKNSCFPKRGNASPGWVS